MKRITLLRTVALAIGYSHGRVETMFVKGQGGEPLRINVSDFDEKQHTKWKGNDPTDSAVGTHSDVNVTGEGVDGTVQTTAAPSAPNFSSAPGTQSDPVDPVKNAVAPKATTADQLLVLKEGSGKNAKYFISDGMGQKITGDRAKLLKIDENGYDTEAAAKAVQTHTNPEPSPN